MNFTLITGASGGIGESFARKFAALGHDLFLVARSEDKLSALCRELSSLHNIKAEYMTLDLSAMGSAERLYAETTRRNLTVDTLINNAGIGVLGSFARSDLDRVLQMLSLNINAPAALTHLYLQDMRARKHGTIINVASTAAFQPVPYMAAYAATKSFVLSLSEALWEENRGSGVLVMALCPGVTDTGFFAAANPTGETKLPPMRITETPDAVVETALKGINQRKFRIISGFVNQITARISGIIPRRLLLKLIAGVMRREKSGRSGK
ncbi:MAG: SDR family NAD(P)-dependent oxidoreductase [Pyrinomonadaceae bacterium]